MTTQEAIDRSVSHDEIVHMDWTAECAAVLGRWADDEARAIPTHEFWGGEEDGSSWRVHLDLLPAVEALRDEAGEAGDEGLHGACVEVLESGDARAWHIVLRALDDATGAVDLDEVFAR